MKQMLKKEVTLEGTRLIYKYKNKHSLDEIALQILNDSVEDGFIQAENDKSGKCLIYDCGSMQSLDDLKGRRVEAENIISLLESLHHILTYLEDSFIDIEYAVFRSEFVFVNDKIDELHIPVIPTQDEMEADVSLRKLVKNLIVTFSYSKDAAELMKKALDQIEKSMKNIEDLDKVIDLLKEGAQSLTETVKEEEAPEEKDSGANPEAETEEVKTEQTVPEEKAAAEGSSDNAEKETLEAMGVNAEQVSELAASVQEAMRMQAQEYKEKEADAAQNGSDAVDAILNAAREDQQEVQKEVIDEREITMPDLNLERERAQTVQTESAEKTETAQAEPEEALMPETKRPEPETAQAEPEETSAPESAQSEEKAEGGDLRNAIIAEYKAALAERDAAYLIRRRNGEVINLQQDIFIIGKIPFCCDYLVSDNPAVSRIHAIIRYNNDSRKFYIFDCRSTNHVYINGKKIAAEEAVELHDLDRIFLATEEFVYHA